VRCHPHNQLVKDSNNYNTHRERLMLRIFPISGGIVPVNRLYEKSLKKINENVKIDQISMN
jgi:hypothetical protein